MNMRSSRSIVTFFHPFELSGYPGILAPGDYEVVTEEELLQGLSFTAYRRTATYLFFRGKAGHAGRAEMREIDAQDLEMALSRDRAVVDNADDSEAAPSRPEDLK